MSNETPSIFLRQASGLVKSAGTLDVFIFNVGLISIGIGVLYTHLFGPANYPGGDIGAASLFATLLMLAVGAGMWAWTVTIPRSGGIYVFVSRGASPTLGFALGFVDACCWLFYNAVAAVLISTAGIAPFFMSLFLNTGDERFLSVAQTLNEPVVAAGCGTVVIILCGLILIVGMRKFFFVQKLMFLVACVGTLAMLSCLVMYSRSHLAENLKSLMPATTEPYDQLIAEATRNGLQTARFNLWQSIRLSVWPFLPLIGGAFSIAIGGEIRDVRRGQGIGILGSITVAGILFAVIGWLSYFSLGADFQAAVTFLDQTESATRLPARPYFSTLVALLSGNVVLTATVCLGFIAWIYFWIPGMLAYAERVLLAMAFDRVAPGAFGSVNERFHTPTVAIAVSVFVSVVLTWLYACTEFFNTLIFIEAATFAWLIAALVGIVYPWSRPTLWQASELGGRKLLGLPIITTLNGLSAIALLTAGSLLWMDPLAAGHDPKSRGTIACVFALGICFFYAMRVYRRREGVDVGLAYQEIPIE